MISELYNFLPTELVWKIYEDLHRSYMVDLNEEFSMKYEEEVVDKNKNYFNAMLPFL